MKRWGFDRNHGRVVGVLLAWCVCVSGGLALAASAAGEEPELLLRPETLELRNGAGGMLRYRHQDVPFKPYVDLLTSPGGINILRDAPADHLHHHGLMFAVRVDGENFWEEKEDSGQQQGARFDMPEATVAPEEGGTAAFLQRVWWTGPDARQLALEDRHLRLKHAGDFGATLLTWSTRLRTVPGAQAPITLTGAHYHGLGMRFTEAMDEAPVFLYSSDAPREEVRGTETIGPGNWTALHATAAEGPVTVAMFDDPANPHPASWFTMTSAFSYLSATLEYHQNEYTVNDFSLRYGVAVWDGHVPEAEVEALYQHWLQGLPPAGDAEGN